VGKTIRGIGLVAGRTWTLSYLRPRLVEGFRKAGAMLLTDEVGKRSITIRSYEAMIRKLENELRERSIRICQTASDLPDCLIHKSPR
jgi:hypothetical protein